MMMLMWKRETPSLRPASPPDRPPLTASHSVIQSLFDIRCTFVIFCNRLRYISLHIIWFDMIHEILLINRSLDALAIQWSSNKRKPSTIDSFCTLCILPWEMVVQSKVCTFFNPSPYLFLHSMINFQMSHSSGNLFCNLRFTVTLAINKSTITTLGLSGVANQCMWSCDCDWASLIAVIFQHFH